MKRTTILADEALLLEVQQLAASQGKTVTAVVQEALRAYVEAHRGGRRLSFAGIGRSGQHYAAGHEEAILAAEAGPVEGWSPRRPGPSGAGQGD